MHVNVWASLAHLHPGTKAHLGVECCELGASGGMRFRNGYALLFCSAGCCVEQPIVHLHLAWLCTILPIISGSSFARSKYLQMAVNMDGRWCTQGGMLVLYLFGISKNPPAFQPFSTKEVSCASFAQWPNAFKWVTSSSRNVVCTATARSASAQPSAPPLLAFFTVFCFVPCFAGFAREC